MYTKSIIQQTVESLKAKDSFRVAIENLMERYNIEDSVFVLKNGFLHEAVEGYFEVENTYDSIDKAVSECNINVMGIRIMNNKLFQTGKLHKSITECAPDKQVFDLDRLENIR